jgi:hypothetical protein
MAETVCCSPVNKRTLKTPGTPMPAPPKPKSPGCGSTPGGNGRK